MYIYYRIEGRFRGWGEGGEGIELVKFRASNNFATSFGRAFFKRMFDLENV